LHKKKAALRLAKISVREGNKKKSKEYLNYLLSVEPENEAFLNHLLPGVHEKSQSPEIQTLQKKK